MNQNKNRNAALFRFSHPAMGTLFEIFLTDIPKKYAHQASQAVFGEIDRLEKHLSRFDPGSDIGQINLLKPGQSCFIGIDVMECLEKAFHIQNQTKGSFAVHYSSLSQTKQSKNLLEAPLTLSRSSGRYQATLNENWTQGLQLDLGGMGKGFALDKAADILTDWDIPQALLHGGTSTALALHSPSNKKGWPVGAASGWDCPCVPKEIMLANRAVSGSGKQVKGDHIIDPRNGLHASGHQAAWVSHPSAAVADALSTAFMVMSASEVKEFCFRNQQVWATVVMKKGVCETFNQNVI
ncbi:MAG: hypothetical protein GF421_04475 [Candidatus Aminicenantes bacterium]|nr:hypothetical protein [Candidatus Aminicenantes bacterium]